MSFCTNCGKEIIENSKFCAFCGASIGAPVAAQPVVEQQPVVVAETVVLNAPVVEQPAAPAETIVLTPPVAEQPQYVASQPVAVEQPQFVQQPQYVPQQPPVAPSFAQNFNEDYLISEEQEFLDITHRFLRWERKALSICGKVNLIAGIVLTAIFSIMFIVGVVSDASMAGSAFSNMFTTTFCIVSGIIQNKVAEKMPLYLDTLYSDFSITNARSGNVGMLVFSIIFSSVGGVFFLINFIRLKSNGTVINRILARQGKF